MIILGGAEAHLLADELAAEGVEVVLTPFKLTLKPRSTTETMRTNFIFHADVLYKKGVKLGLAMSDLYNARNLRWLAGYVSDKGNIKFEDALAMITKNIAEIFDLQNLGTIQVGQKANFILFDDDPFSYASHIKLVALGKNVECKPNQQ
jgi:imidazolonepropionase-like amidohydrolase